MAVSPACRRRRAKLGLELIVCDHHEMKDEGAQHSRWRWFTRALPGSSYPFGQLCGGAAVAFKLAWALARAPKCGGEKVTPTFRELLPLDAVNGAGGGWASSPTWCRHGREPASWSAPGLARLAEKPPVGLQAACRGGPGGGAERAAGQRHRLPPGARINAVGQLGRRRRWPSSC
ncbi:MAG: hypothetical protein U0797_29195 [Gemmataceae bacterium]